jgi:hypothetical protein
VYALHLIAVVCIALVACTRSAEDHRGSDPPKPPIVPHATVQAVLASESLWSSPAANESGRVLHRIEGFTVTSASTVSTNHDSPADDFSLWWFALPGGGTLSAYVGNHPSFPSSNDTGMLVGQVDGGLEAMCGPRESGSGDCRVVLGGFPRFVHFWYRNLGRDDEKEAESIIRSTRLP